MSSSENGRIHRIDPDQMHHSPFGSGFTVNYSKQMASDLGIYRCSSASDYSGQSWKGRLATLSRETRGTDDFGQSQGRKATFTSKYLPGMEYKDTGLDSLVKQKLRAEIERAKAQEKLERLTLLRKNLEAKRELRIRERKRKQEKIRMEQLAVIAMQALVRGFLCRRSGSVPLRPDENAREDDPSGPSNVLDAESIDGDALSSQPSSEMFLTQALSVGLLPQRRLSKRTKPQ